MRDGKTVTRGAIAGLVGAFALAIWFLIIDAVTHEPFHTPLFVARTLLNLSSAQPSFVLLSIYTLFHFLVFAVVGVVVAWLLEVTNIPAFFPLGVALGFLLFDLIFYAGVIITGSNVIRELGWPAVMVGNLIAGISLMGYLQFTGPHVPVKLSDVLRDHSTIREGLVAGALGAVAVMLWFLITDVVRGRTFFTPGALGSALFFGARGMSEVQVTPETVLGYTGVHVVAFLLVGLVASALVEGARREPHLLLGMVLMFVTLEVMFLGVLAIVAEWLLDAIRWWMIIVANLIAAAAMGVYLVYTHPELRENLSHNLEEEVFERS